MNRIFLFFAVFVISIAFPANALLNPASVYCESLGYDYEGGNCIFEDQSSADAWDFLLGKEAGAKGYCIKEGYTQKMIKDSEKCQIFMTGSCAGCILPGGDVVEVTKLMNLSFKETTCGDGTCGLPENHQSCPEDCPSGSIDGLCDAKDDGICDIDCPEGKDPDCKGGARDKEGKDKMERLPFWMIALAIVIVGVSIYLFLKSNWKNNKKGKKRKRYSE